MDVFLTLDYELYLGSASGSVDSCLIKPMSTLAQVAEENGARFTIFVDTTYLNKLRENSGNPKLKEDFEKVCAALKDLSGRGHDLQLHIHPQWLYSGYSDGKWKIDQEYYKLSDISKDQARKAFEDGCNIIEEICGKRPVAFRAGGFSAQPTSLLKELFAENGLNIDCSVYPGNIYHSAQQDYDYSDAPTGKIYKFGDDLCVPDENGDMIELPLSTYRVSPMFYWRLVWQRLSKNPDHRRIGDGISVKTAKSSIRERLTKPSNGFATIDESKISYLKKAFNEARKRGDTAFCIIGHPKLATPYSLKTFRQTLPDLKKNGAIFKTASDIKI